MTLRPGNGSYIARCDYCGVVVVTATRHRPAGWFKLTIGGWVGYLFACRESCRDGIEEDGPIAITGGGGGL